MLDNILYGFRKERISHNGRDCKYCLFYLREAVMEELTLPLKQF